ACATRPAPPPAASADDDLSGWYIGSLPDEPYAIPLVDRSRMPGQRIQVNKTAKERPGWSLVVVIPRLKLAIVARFCSMTAPFQCTKLSSERHKGRANQAR